MKKSLKKLRLQKSTIITLNDPDVQRLQTGKAAAASKRSCLIGCPTGSATVC